MTQLIIDTNDNPVILRACRNMLTELLGDVAPTAIMDDGAAAEPLNDSDVTSASRGEASGPDTGSDTDARKDTLGVVFNPEFCGEATDPFYTSGKRAGQWKKKRGVTDEAYDAWYAEQVATLAAAAAQNFNEEGQRVNTAGAFGGGSEPAGDPAPEDCGAFMGWVSAKQAAGLLTQEDIGNAYAQADVQVTDLFPPNHEDAIRPRIAALYDILIVKAGA